jgi:hypothetical protein
MEKYNNDTMKREKKKKEKEQKTQTPVFWTFFDFLFGWQRKKERRKVGRKEGKSAL